ncbi:sugar phosphate isomerase/epimerase [Pedobacter sp. R20-19]|uniref:sugar phosphate isomerase/epimerase family protein n=1 Tax=Pedobacter sp. R20-19 TaxID=1270196 RepID=UPI0004936341|nr:sugar phosphate isomerase/epimerase family protein [Pedobacter sp. R20-19]
MRLKKLAIIFFLTPLLFSFQSANQTFISLGIVAPIEKDSLISASGFRLFGESVGRMISPSLSEEKFKQNLKLIENAKSRLYICNVMFPGQMKIAGPDVQEQAVLNYTDRLFSRAQQAKVKVIVLGSGAARRLPDGYDVNKATSDFILLGKKIAAIAKKYNVKIALENLQSKETNFLNSVRSAADVVRRINHPNFKLNADIFHMRREGELPQSIIDAKNLLIHCEIAEDKERTLPGIMGDDFRPYLKALRTAKYKGPIFVEAGSNYSPAQMAFCYQYLTKQIKEVYTK